MAPDAPLRVPEMMDTPPIRLLSSSELVASAASSFICKNSYKRIFDKLTWIRLYGSSGNARK